MLCFVNVHPSKGQHFAIKYLKYSDLYFDFCIRNSSAQVHTVQLTDEIWRLALVAFN